MSIMSYINYGIHVSCIHIYSYYIRAPSNPNHSLFSQVRADGLHRAAARGDAEVGHGAASPAFLQKIMVWIKIGGISNNNNSYSYTFQILKHDSPLKLWLWEKEYLGHIDELYKYIYI